MKKLIVALLTAAVAAGISAPMSAATWTKIGTSGFVYEGLPTDPSAYHPLKDRRRIRFSAITVDPSGNIYIAANNAENNLDGKLGGITIFKPNGGGYTKIDVDLHSQNLDGPVTKLVVGGDGYVYGLQNWLEINWSFNRGYPNRILQIKPDGTVTTIWCPDQGAGCVISDEARIGGMTVNWDDGNIYWTTNGASNHWKWNFFWRYDVGSGEVQASPRNGLANNGWSETHRMFDLEYVGGDLFAVIKVGNSEWRADPMGWNQDRLYFAENISNPGWGRDWSTAFAYDRARRQLWAAGRGTGGGGTIIGGTNIMTRWNGSALNAGLFDPVTYRVLGSDVWHTNGNGPDSTGISNFTASGEQYWVNCLAVNPDDGRCWMSYGADKSYVMGDLGYVMVRGPEVWEYYEAGKPEADAYVMGLCFVPGTPTSRCYAVTLHYGADADKGKYSVYYTDETYIPGPAEKSIGDLKKSPGLMTFVKTNGPKVVSYETPLSLDNPPKRYFFIQEPDRSQGIKCQLLDTNVTLNKGDLVTVQGFISIVKGEYVLTGATVTDGPTPGDDPIPLTSNNVTAGGGAVGFQKGMTDRGYGVCQVGLLGRVAGIVLPKPGSSTDAEYAPGTDPSAPDYDALGRYHIYIDDGSAVQADYNLVYDPQLRKWTNLGQFQGIKVYYQKPLGTDPYQPYPGDYVVVTGVVGMEQSDSNWTDPGGTVINIRTIDVRTNDCIGNCGAPPANFGDIQWVQ